jgi:hypothetical protein
MVVWTDNGETSNDARSIWAAHFDGSNWSTPLPVSDGTRTTYDARVAADASGNFIVVWTQDTNAPGTADPLPNLWARRYSSAGAWNTAMPTGLTGLTTNDGAARPHLSINTGGDAVVVWEQTHAGQVSIAGNRYAALSALWGTATYIDNATTPASSPAVTLDNAGNAIAVWQQSDGTALNAWASRAGVGAGWQTTPMRLGGLGSNVQKIQIDMDMAGNALAVWQQNPTGSFNPNLISRRYLLGMDWGSATTLNMTGTDMALDVNSGGKALVVANHKVSSTLGPLTAPWALLYQP